MSQKRYGDPVFSSYSFNCPHCKAYSHQKWYYLAGKIFSSGPSGVKHLSNEFAISECEHCGHFAIWFKEKIVYPSHKIGDDPNPDLPDAIREDFEEARQIAATSPRGAAALLRLCIQKLCQHFGLPGKNLSDDISELVKKGLPPGVQKALDTVRVVGNQSVHPGELDMRDNHEVVGSLFKLVNFIAEKTITDPKDLSEIYDSLPQDKLDQIEKRDRGKQG